MKKKGLLILGLAAALTAGSGITAMGSRVGFGKRPVGIL